MSLPILIALGLALAALAALAGWRGARPWDPRKGPRMVPWRFLMALSATGALGLLATAARLIVAR